MSILCYMQAFFVEVSVIFAIHLRGEELFIHCVSKNDADVAYNFDADQPILVIFGR